MKKMVSFAWLLILVAVAFRPDHCLAKRRAPAPATAAAQSNDNNIDLIHKTCALTEDFHQCVALLQSDPGSLTADQKGLARIMLNIALREAKNAESDVKELLKDPSLNPAIKQCFLTCVNVYELASTVYIPATINSVNSDSYADARKEGSDAFTSIQTCGRDLYKAGGSSKEPAVLDKNKFVASIATLSLGIIYQLG
ncbi:hypothetical protein NE237_026847 [Protea cynaroides]|uniref:Pectinesterase inhibitor domain-containing protein n=1 Tax=Protea cynaroides TaxID=273540 RepID=A0A9Q0JTM3_9MAGN|nr:hypothetical protein NE237_026847 [Protea cynaroides]